MSQPDETDIFDDAADADDAQLTELVAYLDGELNEVESGRMERQLVSDPPLRGYADSLDRTWQLLDSLGEATVSGEFTQKTLASLSTVSSDGDQAAGARWSGLFTKMPVTKILIWTLIGFVSCSAGLLVARISQNRNADSDDVLLLRQFDMLEDYPRIYPIPNATFLRDVSALDEFKGKGKVP